MNRLMFAYGAAIASIALFTARKVIEPMIYLYQELTSGMFALGVVGWLISTLGPLALSIGVWRLARRLNLQWLLHLLFIPSAIAVYQAGASILFFAADVPDGDSIEGYALIVAFGILVLTLLIHAVCSCCAWCCRDQP